MNACSVSDCERVPVKKHGICKMHLKRIARTGRAVHQTPHQRFWAFVDTSGDCWKWTGTANRAGYGHFKASGRQHTATRYLWKEWIGELTADWLICHTCDNPRCVRPDHLFIGTAQDNSNDMKAKGRSRWLPPRNPYRPPGGERHWLAKLTDQQAIEIAERRRSGEGLRALATEYGVHFNTIYRIAAGKNWKTVVEQEA